MRQQAQLVVRDFRDEDLRAALERERRHIRMTAGGTALGIAFARILAQ